MAGPFDNPFGLSALSLPLREQRLKVLASNLANADTPGFKAQDLDFRAALDGAVARQRSVGTGAAGSGVSIIGGGAPDFRRYVTTRDATQPSLDGNTVNGDIEHAAFGRAVLEYRASLTFFESRVRGLMTAITGQ